MRMTNKNKMNNDGETRKKYEMLESFLREIGLSRIEAIRIIAARENSSDKKDGERMFDNDDDDDDDDSVDYDGITDVDDSMVSITSRIGNTIDDDDDDDDDEVLPYPNNRKTLVHSGKNIEEPTPSKRKRRNFNAEEMDFLKKTIDQVIEIEHLENQNALPLEVSLTICKRHKNYCKENGYNRRNDTIREHIKNFKDFYQVTLEKKKQKNKEHGNDDCDTTHTHTTSLSHNEVVPSHNEVVPSHNEVVPSHNEVDDSHTSSFRSSESMEMDIDDTEPRLVTDESAAHHVTEERLNTILASHDLAAARLPDDEKPSRKRRREEDFAEQDENRRSFRKKQKTTGCLNVKNIALASVIGALGGALGYGIGRNHDTLINIGSELVSGVSSLLLPRVLTIPGKFESIYTVGRNSLSHKVGSANLAFNSFLSTSRDYVCDVATKEAGEIFNSAV